MCACADYFQVPYPTPKGLSDCKGCKVSLVGTRAHHTRLSKSVITMCTHHTTKFFPCRGLKSPGNAQVHEGFLAAFNSVTNVSSPSSNILEAWEELSGVPAEQVTDVVCGGHSLGAAIATLCGPWAKSHFPNVRSPFCPPMCAYPGF